jgi:hypothetical protein
MIATTMRVLHRVARAAGSLARGSPRRHRVRAMRYTAPTWLRAPEHAMIRLAVLLLLALAMPAFAAQTQQGVVVLKKWQAMDLCAKKAQAAFPDSTADSLAKRDAQLQTCLEGQNLPSRAPLEPQQ